MVEYFSRGVILCPPLVAPGADVKSAMPVDTYWAPFF